MRSDTGTGAAHDVSLLAWVAAERMRRQREREQLEYCELLPAERFPDELPPLQDDIHDIEISAGRPRPRIGRDCQAFRVLIPVEPRPPAPGRQP